MTSINVNQQWSKIAWTQDSHGQWSSGDLEIRPIVHKHGPVAWQVWLDDECIGRPLGYSSPAQARMAASQMAAVRRVAFGNIPKGREDELRQAVADLYMLCRRMCNQEDRTKRQALLSHATRIERQFGVYYSTMLRDEP